MHTCMSVSYLLEAVFPHLARASGEDHASTGVPPQSVAIRPIKRTKTAVSQKLYSCIVTCVVLSMVTICGIMCLPIGYFTLLNRSRPKYQQVAEKTPSEAAPTLSVYGVHNVIINYLQALQWQIKQN